MPVQVNLPAFDTDIVFCNAEGVQVAKADIAELEAIIIDARIADRNFDHKNPLSMSAFCNRVAQAMSAFLGVKIGLSTATLIMRHVTEKMAELKKTLSFGPLSTPQPPTDSTPSPNSLSLTNPKSSSSVQTSLDKPPLESLESANREILSHLNGNTL